MKKFIMLFLISLFLLFNMLIVTSVAETKVLKEGFYKETDLNFSLNKMYTIQNISPNDSVFVLIFDEYENLQQSLRLKPESQKYNLLSFQPNYKIIIAGNGEVAFLKRHL